MSYERHVFVLDMMFVSHSLLEKCIVRVLDKLRHSRHVLITEPSMNSKLDESLYALTIGCCGEPPPGTGGVQ